MSRRWCPLQWRGRTGVPPVSVSRVRFSIVCRVRGESRPSDAWRQAQVFVVRRCRAVHATEHSRSLNAYVARVYKAIRCIRPQHLWSRIRRIRADFADQQTKKKRSAYIRQNLPNPRSTMLPTCLWQWVDCREKDRREEHDDAALTTRSVFGG